MADTLINTDFIAECCCQFVLTNWTEDKCDEKRFNASLKLIRLVEGLEPVSTSEAHGWPFIAADLATARIEQIDYSAWQ